MSDDNYYFALHVVDRVHLFTNQKLAANCLMTMQQTNFKAYVKTQHSFRMQTDLPCMEKIGS